MTSVLRELVPAAVLVWRMSLVGIQTFSASIYLGTMVGSNICACIGTCKADSVIVKVDTWPPFLCATLAVTLLSLAVDTDSLEGLSLENWCLGPSLPYDLQWCLEPSFCLCSVFSTRSVALGVKSGGCQCQGYGYWGCHCQCLQYPF